jgi:hypothetical protein
MIVSKPTEVPTRDDDAVCHAVRDVRRDAYRRAISATLAGLETA